VRIHTKDDICTSQNVLRRIRHTLQSFVRHGSKPCNVKSCRWVNGFIIDCAIPFIYNSQHIHKCCAVPGVGSSFLTECAAFIFTHYFGTNCKVRFKIVVCSHSDIMCACPSIFLKIMIWRQVVLYDFRYSQQWLLTLLSFGMWHCAILSVVNNILKEPAASMFRMENRHSSTLKMKAAGSLLPCRWRKHMPQKHWYLYIKLNGHTSQKIILLSGYVTLVNIMTGLWSSSIK
jgi:hypothetical protein